jgi:outer membrane protein
LKLRLWVFSALIFGLTAPVAALADVKVGFVNIAAIMEKAPQAEAAAKALEREFSARDSALTADRDAIIELETKLKRDGEVMSESRRADLERKILKRKREFNREKDELKEDFNIRRNEELSQLQHQVYAVIVDLAKSEKYDLMVTERVLYASDRIDITDKVLKRLKATYKKPSR